MKIVCGASPEAAHGPISAQRLLTACAAFAVTIDAGARLVLNPVAIAERLRGLGDGFCSVRGAFDGLAAKAHFRRNPAKCSTA